MDWFVIGILVIGLLGIASAFALGFGLGMRGSTHHRKGNRHVRIIRSI
jgi:hypothetical protein